MLRWWRKEKYLRESDRLCKSGKFDAALSQIESGLRDNPGLDLLKQKAWLLKEAGRLDEAKAHTESLLAKHPEESVLHLLLGEILLLVRDYVPARESLFKAIDLGGENLYAEFLIGKTYIGTNDLDKAAPYFESMIKYDKNFVSSRLLAVAEFYLMERGRTDGR